MAMAAPIAMHTDADVLTLAQWFSPTYPVGSFAYSHGLEWSIQAGEVRDGESLRIWLTDILRHGSGRSDARFLAAAFQAENDAELWQIDKTCRAFAPSMERLKETDLQGAAFCRATSAIWCVDLDGLAYPVAVGRAAQLCDLPMGLSAQMYLHAFTSNLVSAGQRLMALGQTEAQALIRGLTPLCGEIAVTSLAGDLGSLTSTSFLADIASMKHESQYSRIFRT